MGLFEQLKNSTASWVVLALITIISLGWAIYTYFSNNRKKQFSAAISDVEIIRKGNKRIENLDFFYKDKSIKSLTISRCSIWNSGNKVINAEDLVAEHQLEIYVDKGAEILEAQIIAEVETTNRFQILEITSERVKVGFDYVDTNEGITLQIIHTGKRGVLCPKCKIKGGKDIKIYSPTPKRETKHIAAKAQKKAAAIAICLYIVLVVVLSTLMTIVHFCDLRTNDIVQFLFARPAPKTIMYYVETVTVVIMWIVAVFAVIQMAKILRNLFSVGVPTELKIYKSSIQDD